MTDLEPVKALDVIFAMAEDDVPWTLQSLCKLHSKCMEASKFRTSFSKLPNGSLVNVKTKYLPTGRTRGSTRTNVTINSYHGKVPAQLPFFVSDVLRRLRYAGPIALCPFQEVCRARRAS